MLKFEAQDEVSVYSGDTGFIVFKAIDFAGCDHAVLLTIGQFRKVIKYSDDLIAGAEANKRAYEESKNEIDS